MINDSNEDLDPEFFDQLCRGEQEMSGIVYPDLHRIPPDVGHAAGQVRQLLIHARNEIGEVIATAGNILRWHGRSEIVKALGEEHAGVIDQLELLRETSRKYDNPSA
jgi:hypothetical protein